MEKNMKIIDGTNATLGRLASYAAKESLKGEEIIILNCAKVIITGSKGDILKTFREKREKVGSGQRGPKHSRSSYKIVKRTIQGMLPNYRRGRGGDALKRIKCFDAIPKEFENQKMIKAGKEKTTKFIHVKDISKKNDN